MLKIALDGNEANVHDRVGSNVYAFEMISALYRLIHQNPAYSVTVLLAAPPLADLPPASEHWHYRVIKPARLWTQFALPLFLFTHFWQFDCFYTPGHYAPRFSPLPYLSTVLDLAFLKFPQQFRRHDLKQLTNWTKYSVHRAKKVAVISHFTAQEVQAHYHLPPEDIILAPPGLSATSPAVPPASQPAILKSLGVTSPFFLYLGTIQPRKNLIRLIKAFTIFMSHQKNADFQLVIAGKIGWLADAILATAKKSSFASQIIFTNFVSADAKYTLLTNCLANFNLGLYEGFGIPALEALNVGSLPVVANNTSLPEVIGRAGLEVDPTQISAIAKIMDKIIHLSPAQKKSYQSLAAHQLEKFSYDKSARLILDNLAALARHA